MIFFCRIFVRAPRSSRAALIACYLSSQIEYKNLGVIERLELQRAFFANSRAIACVQQHTIKLHGTARHLCPDIAARLEGKIQLLSSRETRGPDVHVLMHGDGTVAPVFRG